MTLQKGMKELTEIISISTLGTNCLQLLELLEEYKYNCSEEMKPELQDIIERLKIFTVGIHGEGVKKANILLEEM